MKHTVIAVAGATLAAVLALGACSSKSVTGSNASPVGDNHPTAAASTETTSTPTKKPSSASPSAAIKPFGSTFTWDDNLSVTVSEPEPFTPSNTAATSSDFKQFFVFTVTIVNKTGDVWDPVLFGASVQTGNRESRQVFDTAQGISGPPSTKLLDGRESTFKIAFGIADPSDIVMEVRPDFKRKPGFFKK